MRADGKTPSWPAVLVAFVVIGTTFITLTIKSWRKWPDLVVDFGAQLYMPWQISNGAVLYRDIQYLPGGPLSQYYHALLFKIFGVSFLTLIVSNLVVLALMVRVIYIFLRHASDQITAVTACVSVLTVFAFAHYSTLGIFNYITPYSAEVVHGVALSVLAVALLARWLQTQDSRLAGGVGLCTGLVFLTKPDIFLSLVLTMVASAVLFLVINRTRKTLRQSLLVMAAAATIPPLGFFFWFLRVESPVESVRSVLAAWIPLLTTSAASNPFYRWCMGLDTPWLHVKHTFLQFFELAAVVSVCALLCSWRKVRTFFAILVLLPCVYLLIRISWNFNWFNCGDCLPLVCLSLVVLLIWQGFSRGWEPPIVYALLWSVWSLTLLAKLGLYCRIWHYGFALAMPAFVSGVYFLLWALPRELERWGVRPLFFRSLLWTVLVVGLIRLTQPSLKLYSDKTLPVGSGSDTIFAFDPHYRPRDAQVAAALDWIETKMPPASSLAVLPEGAMLNFLSRHANPCSYIAWNPPEIAAFGQGKMTAALMAHSPDYVIEVFAEYHDYGETYFGAASSFGLDAQQWINAHYKLVDLIGDDWVKDGQFGVKILKKN